MKPIMGGNCNVKWAADSLHAFSMKKFQNRLRNENVKTKFIK